MASQSFHSEMMAALNTQVMTAGREGHGIPSAQYYAMRRALRKAVMTGKAINTPEQLAAATLQEMR